MTIDDRCKTSKTNPLPCNLEKATTLNGGFNTLFTNSVNPSSEQRSVTRNRDRRRHARLWTSARARAAHCCLSISKSIGLFKNASSRFTESGSGESSNGLLLFMPPNTRPSPRHPHDRRCMKLKPLASDIPRKMRGLPKQLFPTGPGSAKRSEFHLVRFLTHGRDPTSGAVQRQTASSWFRLGASQGPEE